MPYEDIAKLFMALLAGAAIGAEREYRSKSAGLRTLSLICVGSALFTILSSHLTGDPSRIAANIVTGIGFLGAGIIFREASHVRGLTTAATVWATAALGMAIGSGYYMLGLAGVLLVLLILLLMVPLQNAIERNRQARTYRIVVRHPGPDLDRYAGAFKQFRLEAKHPVRTLADGRISARWTAYGRHRNHERFARKVLEDADVLEFDF